jgi:predicted transcriptional regulator
MSLEAICRAVSVSFELPAGYRLEAGWDGGRHAVVEVETPRGHVATVERLDMLNPDTGRAGIPVAVDALEELVAWRLSDPDTVAELMAIADAHALANPRYRYPLTFSAN